MITRIIAVLLLAVSAEVVDAAYIRGSEWLDNLPPVYSSSSTGRGIFGPVESDLILDGWATPTEAQQSAHSAELAEQAQAAQEVTQSAYAAKVAAVAQQASVFRWVLQQHFGVGAETNRAVGVTSVSAYFIQRRMAGTSAATDASDAIILQQGFEALSEITGDGTTWSFPWEMIP
jgi:hypothetical protein